jgi:phthiodiolone/phenolphthiodiolone dimycocerosates ketoreductase
MRDIKYGALVPLADYQAARGASIAAEQAGYDFTAHGDTCNLWIPRGLWTKDLTPLAEMMDVDQAMDAWLMMGDCATHTEKIHIGPTVCDAIRRNPTNYAQLLLTLDHMSQGRSFLGLATGEYRHFGAYGIARDKPFTYLEESVKIIKMLTADNADFITYDGPIWKLDRAIMALRPYGDTAPPVLVAGSSPRALRIAGQYADGWIAMAPTGSDAEKTAACIKTVKDHAEKAGRDPDKLRFYLTALCLMGESDDEVEEMTHHPLIRWDATSLMLNGKDWETWGFGEHPIRPDFSYSRDLTSMWWNTEDAWKVIEATPPQVVRNTRFAGTPTQVADMIQPFIEAGVTWVNPCDWAMFVQDPVLTMSRDLAGDVCAELRKHNSQPVLATV